MCYVTEEIPFTDHATNVKYCMNMVDLNGHSKEGDDESKWMIYKQVKI